MKLSVDRDTLLRPLQAVQGVVERRQTLPILTNVLLTVAEGELEVTATDMELELVSRTALEDGEPGEITVPARKLVDICRSLPGGSRVDLQVEGERVLVRSGRSRFTLSSLPASEYPSTEAFEAQATVSKPNCMARDRATETTRSLKDQVGFAVSFLR